MVLFLLPPCHPLGVPETTQMITLSGTQKLGWASLHGPSISLSALRSLSFDINVSTPLYESHFLTFFFPNRASVLSGRQKKKLPGWHLLGWLDQGKKRWCPWQKEPFPTSEISKSKHVSYFLFWNWRSLSEISKMRSSLACQVYDSPWILVNDNFV